MLYGNEGGRAAWCGNVLYGKERGGACCFGTTACHGTVIEPLKKPLQKDKWGGREGGKVQNLNEVQNVSMDASARQPKQRA
eukprot:354228-Chlamydomonas_euryale.AAC.2